MELTPELSLFLLIVVAPVVLIGGLGATLALGLYNLDRSVRNADKMPRRKQPESTSGAPAMTMNASGGAAVLSATSQLVMEDGTVEDAEPSIGVSHTKLGMWMFLASEVMFFTALIGAYVVFRATGQFEVPEAELNLWLASLNTFLLIVSSFTVVQALDSIIKGKLEALVSYLLVTLALGIVFLSIQGYEWAELFAHGITPTSDLFGTLFFVTTGFHGLHVGLGLLALVVVMLRAFKGDFDENNYAGIEGFGLYWHFVDIVWILLFTIIYLIL